MEKNKNPWRIGLLGIYHESNTFIDQHTTLTNFEQGHLFYGQEIISEYQNAYHEIAGMIERLNQSATALIPLMYAEATPGGIISREAGAKLVEKMKLALAAAGNLDGLLVVPHGAAVSEDYDDFDGYWLSLVRSLLPQIPIIGTLDPHANASQQMIAAADAFIAYKTNPHLDQKSVGKEAASLMIDTLERKINPLQKLLSSRVAISIEQQYTSESPCLELYQKAQLLSKKEGILSISILLGFPYADVHEMGSAVIVVTDDNAELANATLEELDLYLLENQESFDGQKTSIDEALQKMTTMPKPVLFLDMGDNVGGGSPGDSTFLLHALESTLQCKSFICIKDPEAVAILEEQQPGDEITMTIGGKSDQNHGSPLNSTVRLFAIFDGVFHESEPRHGGQVHFDMGRTAIVETLNGTTIMLTTLRMVPFSLQQLLHFDVRPEAFDVIVAKGVQAPIAAYAPVCPSLIRVNTSGITTADMRQLNYKKRRVPLFPFETIVM